MKFYNWFCEYNFSSLNFLNTVVPLPMKNKIKERDEKFFIYKTPFKLKNINSSILDNKEFIFKHSFYDEKISLIKNIIDKNSKDKKLTLIISPTKAHIEHVLSSLLNFYTNNDYRIITGNTNLSKYRHNEIWNSIIGNKIKFLIGTKMSIFYPMDNVATIIIDESENENLNQIDINPRFEFLPNAFELAKINNSQIIFTSYCPSAYLYNLAQEKKLKLLESKEKINSKISLLDMSVKYFENYVHYNCEEEIKKTLLENPARIATQSVAGGKKILFLLNKKGYSKNLKCCDCGFVFQCEHCNSILSFNKENGLDRLHCYNCEKSIDVPTKCPKCSSIRLDNHGIGIEQFVEIIKKMFSDKKIIIIDKDNYENLKTINSADITIATKIIVDHIKEKQFGLIILPLTHQFLNNHFDSNEEFFRFTSKILSLKPEDLILQILNEQKTYYHIYNKDYFSMIKEELENRRIFHYPPFSNIMKITIKNKNKDALDKKTIELYDKLRINISANTQIQIIEPPINKLRSFFIKNILIKYKNDSDIENIKNTLEDVDIIEKNYFKL